MRHPKHVKKICDVALNEVEWQYLSTVLIMVMGLYLSYGGIWKCYGNLKAKCD